MRLGSTVPNFKAETTIGSLELYTWQNNLWSILYCNPADFTPTGTEELKNFALEYSEFAIRQVKIIAYSADSLKNHKDWIEDIRSYSPDLTGYFPIPIIADPSKELATQFDVFDDQNINFDINKSHRAIYIIDPNRKVRLSMFYPMSTGISIDELLRCIDALQLTDRLKVVATPANWTLGDKIMILPDVSDDDAKRLFPEGIDYVKMPSGQNYVRTTTDYNGNIIHYATCPEMID